MLWRFVCCSGVRVRMCVCVSVFVGENRTLEENTRGTLRYTTKTRDDSSNERCDDWTLLVQRESNVYKCD